MARSRDISKVLSSNSTLATDAEVAATYQTKTTAGLTLLTPSTIANTSGTASIGTNGTVSFSAASTVSLNNVFNSTYTNYKVIFNLSLSAATYIGTRFRVSGSDNSSSQYVYSGPALTSGNGVENAWSNGLTTSFLEMVRVSVDTTGGTFDFQDPFETKNTLVTGLSIWNRSSTLINSLSYFGVLKNSTSYDGFTFFPNTGTMTGTVSVYGYNK